MKAWKEKERKYYKYGDLPNANIVGSPTMSYGSLSNFSANDYAYYANTLPDWSYSEIVVKFKTNSFTNMQTLFGSPEVVSTYSLPLLAVSNTQKVFYIIGDSSALQSTSTLQTNTWYWIKLTSNGSSDTKLYLSLDGINYNLEDTRSRYLNKSGGQFQIGRGYLWGSIIFYLDGSIDLKETYIKINNNMWWHGTLAEISTEDDYDFYRDEDVYKLKKVLNVRHYYKYQYSTFTRPNLSADGEMGGSSFAVSANNYVSGYQVYKAVDGNNSTGWEVSSPTTAYYIFYNPIELNVSEIKMRNWTGSGNIDASKGGKVYGSNDNSNWTELKTYTNTVYSSGGEWIIDLSSNTNYYKYYKITCTDGTSNGRSYWNVAEMTPYGTIRTVTDGTASDYDFYKDENAYYAFTV